MNFVKTLSVAASAAAIAAVTALSANAQTTNLRIQTHFSQETLSGQLAEQYINNIQEMSNGEISVEMFYASSVVKSAETFDAAATGILDCDMTAVRIRPARTRRSSLPAILMGGYANPYQQMAWLLHGGWTRHALNNLYNGAQHAASLAGGFQVLSPFHRLQTNPWCGRFQGLEIPLTSRPCHARSSRISVPRRS